MHGVMVLQRVTAATERQRQQQQQKHNQLCPTQITTDPAHLPSSGCRLSGHDESPDAVGGTREVVRVGRAGTQLAIVAPRSMSHPALGRSYCVPVHREASVGGRVQAQPKGVEPALSCAPTSCLNKRRVLPLFVQVCTTRCRFRRSRGPGQAAVPWRPGRCVRQAKHDEDIADCLSCASAGACDAAPGWKRLETATSIATRAGQQVWQPSGSIWPLTVGRPPLADGCDQQPGPRVRFHWSGMAGPGFFSRVLEVV